MTIIRLYLNLALTAGGRVYSAMFASSLRQAQTIGLANQSCHKKSVKLPEHDSVPKICYVPISRHKVIFFLSPAPGTRNIHKPATLTSLFGSCFPHLHFDRLVSIWFVLRLWTWCKWIWSFFCAIVRCPVSWPFWWARAIGGFLMENSWQRGSNQGRPIEQF